MKKILLLICMAAAVASCEKDPDMGELDSDMVVYTDHDSQTDFGDFQTYFLPDSILEAGGHHASYWKDENAQQLINAVETQMNNRGYRRITDPEQKTDADLGVQLSYIAQTTNIISGGYWGGGHGWYGSSRRNPGIHAGRYTNSYGSSRPSRNNYVNSYDRNSRNSYVGNSRQNVRNSANSYRTATRNGSSSGRVVSGSDGVNSVRPNRSAIRTRTGATLSPSQAAGVRPGNSYSRPTEGRGSSYTRPSRTRRSVGNAAGSAYQRTGAASRGAYRNNSGVSNSRSSSYSRSSSPSRNSSSNSYRSSGTSSSRSSFSSGGGASRSSGGGVSRSSGGGRSRTR